MTAIQWRPQPGSHGILTVRVSCRFRATVTSVSVGDGLLRGADSFGILQQRRLIFLQLDEEASRGLRSGLERLFGSAWHRA